jgi:UDP-N-acetylmuramoyl-tripeptide--D-alanyl-D-alanine ligase
MTQYHLQHVLEGTGGRLAGPELAHLSFGSLERDARTVSPGDLFIAIKGERFDGHDFVVDAAANGAAAAIVSQAWADAHTDAPLPLIVVDEPIPALQRWAAWWRRKLDCRVVGITGSIGKTSTKEAVSGVLRQHYRVHHSAGNLNTEVGLPLSIVASPPDAEVMVLEMGGAYAFGELALLAGIAKPNVGVVTNVFPVHLERMGTIENIAKTKAELVESLTNRDTAVLNGDDERVRAMAVKAQGRVIFYGHGPQNHVRVEDVESNGFKGSSFWLNIGRQRTHVRIPFVGAAGVQTSLAAIAVGHAFGMDVSEITYGLLDRNVEVRLVFVPGPRGSQLIDDTYNASRPSVLSALNVLDLVPAKRKVAVLGEMRELGSSSVEEHTIVGGRAGLVADVLLALGGLAKPLADEARAVAASAGRQIEIIEFDVSQKGVLLAWLQSHLRQDDVVLLKGSRGLEMEHLVRELRADANEQTAS